MHNCKDCVCVPYTNISIRSEPFTAERLRKLYSLGFTHMVERAGMIRKCADHRRGKRAEFYMQRRKGKTCASCGAACAKRCRCWKGEIRNG